VLWWWLLLLLLLLLPRDGPLPLGGATNVERPCYGVQC
jgi:hypothetical protein